MYSARRIATDQHNHLPRIGGCTKIYSQTIVLLGICFFFTTSQDTEGGGVEFPALMSLKCPSSSSSVEFI